MICPVCYPEIEDRPNSLAILLASRTRRPDHTPDQLATHHPEAEPDCPACQTWRMHSPADRAVYHQPERPPRRKPAA